MADVLIRPTEPGDIGTLFENLRPSDLAECQAYGGETRDIRAGIQSSADRSMLCWTALVDGELACVIGCAPVSFMGGIGSPWMLGTPVLDKHSRILVKRTPSYIARMRRLFPHLVNFVHTENTTSVRWLRRLGFTLRDPVPVGPRGALFYPFEMKD